MKNRQTVRQNIGRSTACPYTASREIAHIEAPGVIDLRVARAGWRQVKEHFSGDPAVRRDPSRRDWIELHVSSSADLDRLGGLLAAALAANSSARAASHVSARNAA
jgi:hypothetical protein